MSEEERGEGGEGAAPERSLLAIDLGLRLGFARYDARGRLLGYRSQHYGSRAKLKGAVFGILAESPGLEALILEGDKNLGGLFARLARKRGAEVIWTDARQWREALMPSRDRRSGADAKQSADGLARSVIEWSGAPRPTSLRHDAAEAILIGLWGAHRVGWLDELPEFGAGA